MTLDEALAFARARVEAVLHEAVDRLDMDLRDRRVPNPAALVAEAREDVPVHLARVMAEVERWLRNPEEGGVN